MLVEGQSVKSYIGDTHGYATGTKILPSAAEVLEVTYDNPSNWSQRAYGFLTAAAHNTIANQEYQADPTEQMPAVVGFFADAAKLALVAVAASVSAVIGSDAITNLGQVGHIGGAIAGGVIGGYASLSLGNLGLILVGDGLAKVGPLRTLQGRTSRR